VRVRVRAAAREWSGRAVLDFNALLPLPGEAPSGSAAQSGAAARERARAAAADELGEGEGEDAAPSFSLVTGALSRRGPPRGAASVAAAAAASAGTSAITIAQGGGALVTAAAAAAAAAVRAVSGPGSGAAYLRDKRAWRGLAYEAEGEGGEGLAPTVAEGRVGIAAGYAGEGGGSGKA